MKQRVTGIWRSYKVFHFSGKVEAHNETSYLQVSVDEEETFTQLRAESRKSAISYTCDQWQIAQVKNRCYIYLQKRQVYEIITLEQDDMVLLDIVKGEKIFFAKMPGWYRRIEPTITSVRHIREEQENKER